MFKKILFVLGAIFMVSPIAAWANPVLHVGDAKFTREDLETQFEQRAFRAKSGFSEDIFDLSGPLLTDVIEAGGVQGKEIIVVAMDGYAKKIPASMAKKHGLIVAVRSSGKFIPESDRGPFYIAAPEDKKLVNSHGHNKLWVYFVSKILAD